MLTLENLAFEYQIEQMLSFSVKCTELRNSTGIAGNSYFDIEVSTY